MIAHPRMLIVIALLALVAGLGMARPWATPSDVFNVTLDQVPTSVVVARGSGHAFVITTDAGDAGHVSMIDTATGALLSTIPIGTGSYPFAMAVDQRTERVFVVDSDSNRVRTIDAVSGAVLRSVAVGQSPGPLRVDEQSGHVFVVSTFDDTVRMLDARSGRLLRTIALASAPSDAVVDGRTGRAFVSSYDGAISAIDTHSGMLLFTRQIDTGISALAVDEQAGRIFVMGYGSFMGGLFNSNTVATLDAASGRVLRSARVGLMPSDLIVDQRSGRAFTLDESNNTVSMLDAHTGALVRAWPSGQPTTQSGQLSIDRRSNHLFFVAPNGVTVFDARSGAMLRRSRLSPSHSSSLSWIDAAAVDEQSGRLFIAGDNGDAAWVNELDTRSGVLVHTIPVGVSPMTMALDDRTGRAVVIGIPMSQPNLLQMASMEIGNFLSQQLSHLLRRSIVMGPDAGTAQTSPGGVSVVAAS